MFGTYRTILALMVVAQHLGGIPMLGVYAVFAFYTLSGFLMTQIMHTSYGYTGIGRAKYAVNRFLRVYPLYWLALAASVALIAIVGSEAARAYYASLYLPETQQDWVRNVLILRFYREKPALIPPGWSLTVELCYYVAIGLGISKSRQLAGAWFGVSVVYHVAVNLLGLDMSWIYFRVWAASLPFAAGALLFHYREAVRRHLTQDAGLRRPLWLLSLIAANWLSGILLQRSTGVCFYVNFVLNTILIADLMLRRELGSISRHLDGRVGDYCYPIFLIHFAAGLATLALLQWLGLPVAKRGPVLLVASLPALLTFAWLLILLLERPVETLRDRVKAARSVRAEPPPP